MRKILGLILGLELLVTNCSYNNAFVIKKHIPNLLDCTIIAYKGDKISIMESFCNSNGKITNSKFYYFNKNKEIVQIDYFIGNLSESRSDSCSLISNDEICKNLFKIWPYLR